MWVRPVVAPTSAPLLTPVTCRRWRISVTRRSTFVIHHTAADTIERIAPEEVSRAVAAVAVMTYVVAEMPERLPRP